MRSHLPYVLLACWVSGCQGGISSAGQDGSLGEALDDAGEGEGDGSLGTPNPSSDAGTADGGMSPNGPLNLIRGPVGCTPTGLEPGVNLEGYILDRYAWSDASCSRRMAGLVRNDAGDPGGSNGGYLRSFTWSDGATTRETVGGSSGTWRGFGYVVNHYNSTAETSRGRQGSYRNVYAGAHHAIHEFKWTLHMGAAVEVTVHWFFATGRSAPVYAITFDLSDVDADQVEADARAPYGEIPFEGSRTEIGGVGWGDEYRFTTTGDGPVSLQTPWDYREANSVPYTRMWSKSVDAEWGLVQTEPFAQRVAGGDYGHGLLTNACQGRTSETQGDGCSTDSEIMPQTWLWPFQMNQYELSATTYSHRMAWGTSYGAVGHQSVQAFGRTVVGHPRVSYSVLVVVDPHSKDPVIQQATQVERQAASQVTASLGSVASMGIGGPGRADQVAYPTPGYDPVYGVFELSAASTGVTASIDPRGQELVNPIFHVRNWGASPKRVTLDGVELASSDYFASVDAAGNALWLTLNGRTSSRFTLQVQ